MKTEKRNWNLKGAALLTAELIALPLMAAVPAEAAPLCSMTSRDAKTSCQFEVREELYEGMGNCNNLPALAERLACRGEAIRDSLESLGECNDIFDARQEVCEDLGQGAYHPEIDPANFLEPSEILADPNPYFPLVPGTIWEYEGGDETITVTVTEDTKEILGVTCIVVRDVVEEDDELIEDTFDWYAQDREGNVWYFGEIAKNYEDGELVDVEGSWKAGTDHAKAGILMKRNPQVGDVYRQEFLLGDAEDMGAVLGLAESVTVPAGSFSGCLKTKDYTPIEPDALEHKFYAPGVGMVLELDPESGERVELVEYSAP